MNHGWRLQDADDCQQYGADFPFHMRVQAPLILGASALQQPRKAITLVSEILCGVHNYGHW
jgi:hypothetical protein